MLSEIKVKDSASVAVIDIGGVIGVPEQMQFGNDDERVATYERFAAALAEIRSLKAKEVVVNIRSTGGDVNDALLIFDALRGLDARVVTRCYGYVASAATVIAQAASDGGREVSSGSLYLIHCCESMAEGNTHSLSAAKELLDRTDERLAAIYAERSGRPAEEFAALMNVNGGKGRWLTPDETVEAGLADAVIAAKVSDEVLDRNYVELAAVCKMLGITPPPALDAVVAEGKRFAWMRAAWKTLKDMLDRGGKMPEGTVAENVQPTACGKSVPTVAVAAAGLDAAFAAAQDEAFQTCVKAVEDPSAEDYRPSPNEEAYRQDAINMRRSVD